MGARSCAGVSEERSACVCVCVCDSVPAALGNYVPQWAIPYRASGSAARIAFLSLGRKGLGEECRLLLCFAGVSPPLTYCSAVGNPGDHYRAVVCVAV